MPFNWKGEYYSDPLNPNPQPPMAVPTGDAAAGIDLTAEPGWNPRELPTIPSQGEAQKAFEYEAEPDTSLGSIAGMILGLPGRALLGADQELRGLLGGNTWEDQADQYRDFYDPNQKDIFNRRPWDDPSSDTRAFGHTPPVPGERFYKMLTGESQRVVHAGEDIYRQLQARRAGRVQGIKERGLWQEQSQNILEGVKAKNDLGISLEYGRATAKARLNKLNADIRRTGILNRKTLEEIHRLKTLLEPADQAKLNKLLHDAGVTEDFEAAVGDTGQAGADFRESLGMDETSSEVVAKHPNLAPTVMSNLPNARAAADRAANPIGPDGLPKSFGSELTAKLEDFKAREDYKRLHPPPVASKSLEQIRQEAETKAEVDLKTAEERIQLNKRYGIGQGDRMPPEEYAWREKTKAYEKDIARDEKALYEGWYGKRGVLEAYKGRTRDATPNMFGGNLGESGSDIAKEQKDLKKLYDSGAIDLGTALGVASGAIDFTTAQSKLLQPTPSPRPTVEPYVRTRTDMGGELSGIQEDTDKQTASQEKAARIMFDQMLSSSTTPNLDRNGKPVTPTSSNHEAVFQKWYTDTRPGKGWRNWYRSHF